MKGEPPAPSSIKSWSTTASLMAAQNGDAMGSRKAEPSHAGSAQVTSLVSIEDFLDTVKQGSLQQRSPKC